MNLKALWRSAVVGALAWLCVSLGMPGPALAAYFSIYSVTETGSTNIVSVPFPYVSQSNVYVSVNGVQTSAYTWLTSSTIQMTASAASLAGSTITVQRLTAIASAAVTFQAGGLDPTDLNTSAAQVLYSQQEIWDEYTQLGLSQASSGFITRTGNSTEIVTYNTALGIVSGHCLQLDANGNAEDSGSACGSVSGGGTVAGGTAGQLAIYPSNGSSVSGSSSLPSGLTGSLPSGLTGSLPAGLTGTLPVGITGTTQASGDNSTKLATDAFVQSSLVPGIRNLLINGEDDLDQRNNGAYQVFSAGAALAYSDDRFYVYVTGGNVTGQNIAGAAGIARRQYQFSGYSGGGNITRCQRIESVNSWQLAGGYATFSAYISDTSLSTIGWSVSYANATDTFGTVAAPNVTAIASGTFTVSSTLTRYSATMAIPSAATTGLQVCLTATGQVSGLINIANEQFEAATSASASPTAIEHRPWGFELSLAQRYHQQYLAGASTGSLGVTGVATGASQIFGAPYPFPAMRTTPTFSFIGSWTCANASGITSLTNPGSVFIYASSTAAGFAQCYAPVNTGGYSLDAEL